MLATLKVTNCISKRQNNSVCFKEEQEDEKKFNVQITYTGMIEETIEAESLDEAENEAHDFARMEVPFDCDEYEINVEEEYE